MKYLAALLALLYSVSVTPEQLNAQWWWSVGYCTATDKAELGGCGKFELRKIDWRK